MLDRSTEEPSATVRVRELRGAARVALAVVAPSTPTLSSPTRRRDRRDLEVASCTTTSTTFRRT